MQSRSKQRNHRHHRVRAKISGTKERPRLAVARSHRMIGVQLIDDNAGHTMVAASSQQLSVAEQKKTKQQQAAAVGKMVAAKAKKEGVSVVVFDRGGHRYHGRVKALAEAARAGGLQF